MKTLALVLAAAILCTAIASAELEMSIGIRYVNHGTVADCGAKAKTALNAYLQNATETPAGSGDWIAFGAPDSSGTSSSAAVVRCGDAGSGDFEVTFTCSVQSPGSSYTSNALCLDIAHNFSGKAETALATPTPVPSGCATNSLVGDWEGTGPNGKLTMNMTLDGELTDQDNVSGNWILKGMDATLTYYGQHTATLTADGKHLRGSGFDLNRKC